VQLYLPDGLAKVGTGVLTVFASHSGQACTAQTRVLVPHDAVDSALEQIRSVLPFLPVGDPVTTRR